ncbi:MAG: hypothetical protein QXO21_04495 [Candidatus Anstonellales archaeon]
MINIIILVFFLYSCASVKTPIWVKEFGTKTFSKDGIEGIGFAHFNRKDKSSLIHAREVAYNEAIKNLSIKLKTEIKGTIQLQLQDKITQIDKKYKNQSLDQIEVLTDLTFSSVLGKKYFEEYVDHKNSLYWVYVWTTKSEMQKAIMEELAKQEAKNNEIMMMCVKQLRTVDDYINSGKVVLAVKLLQQTLSWCNEIKGIAFFDKLDNISLRSDVETKLNKILSSLNLIPLTPSNIETFKDKQLSIEAMIKLVLKYNNRDIPVVSFPLCSKFLNGSGEIENSKYTDTEGVARFKIYKLTSKENTIEFSADIGELKNQLLNPEVFSHLKVIYTAIAKSIRETKKILVKVKAEDGTLVNLARGEIISQLKSAEFNISDFSFDFVLEVSFDLEYVGNKITLPDGTQAPFAEIYSGSIVFELRNIYNNDIILSNSFSDIKGFGRTKKEAQQNAIKKLCELIVKNIVENF